MGDREENEGRAEESTRLTMAEEPAVELKKLDSVTGTEGDTDLHNAVLSVCRKNKPHTVSYRDIDELMERQETALNLPNKNGYTAIGLAVNHRDNACVEHMLNHPSANRLYLDYYPADSEYTVREIIERTYPDLHSLLTEPLKENLNSPDTDKKLLAALQHDEYNIFRETLDSNNSNPWYDEPYYSSLLEIACQKRNGKEFVKSLLDNGANPNITNSVTDMPLLHATARSGNFEVLKMLLNNKEINVDVKDNEQRTILHWWAKVSEKNPDDNKRLESCFNLLLKKGFSENGSIEDQDILGNTPFSFAVERGYIDRIVLMLDNDNKDTLYDHFVHILESASKSLLEAILDYCFDSNDEPTNSKELEVTFKLTPLFYMADFSVESNHKYLLKHPVMSIFVNLLWKKMKYIFFCDVAFYVTFLLSLSAYILFSEFCNMQNNRGVANNTNDLLSFNDTHVLYGMEDERLHNIWQILWYAVMMLWGLLCVREMCQLLLYRKDYINSKENWLELLLIFVTFISCSGIVDSIEVIRHLFAFAILLGWFELLLLLGRLPVLSVQTEILKTVSWTFLKFMAGYIFLILAFAFSFYLLFKEDVQENNAILFTNPLISILKTTVMFAGEFEASNLPFDNFPGTSHVIFLLFVFFVSIVLLNLLNGLAVGDTGKIRQDAETLSIEVRLSLISCIFDVYLALHHLMTSDPILTDEKYKLYPNKTNSIGAADLRSLQRIITEKRERNMKEKKIEHDENWKLCTQKLSTLLLKSEKMEQMLKKILTHLKIPEP